MTGRICVSTSIFITGLTPGFWNDDCLMGDEWLSSLSWITLQHPADQECLICSGLNVAVVCLIRIHWLSTAFLQRGIFVGWVKMLCLMSVAGRYAHIWVFVVHHRQGRKALSFGLFFDFLLFRGPNYLVTNGSTWVPNAYHVRPFLSWDAPVTATAHKPSRALLPRRNCCTSSSDGMVWHFLFKVLLVKAVQVVRFPLLLRQTAHECLLTRAEVLLITLSVHSWLVYNVTHGLMRLLGVGIYSRDKAINRHVEQPQQQCGKRILSPPV